MSISDERLAEIVQHEQERLTVYGEIMPKDDKTVMGVADRLSALTELHSLRAAKVRAIREGDGERLAAEMRASSRFPYTYAADWVRKAGLADNRADASQWRQRAARDAGREDAVFAEELALEYIADAVAVAMADMERAARFKRLTALAAIPATGGEKE